MAIGWGSNETNVTSVNGDFGPIVTLDASEIPSDGAGTVQDDIDVLSPIATAAELYARFPPVADVITIDEPVEFKLPVGVSTIDMTPNRIVGVYPGALTGIGTRVQLLTSVDATFVSGELTIDGVDLVNTSFGASAAVLDLTAIGGRFVELMRIGVVGQNPGTIHDTPGAIIQTMALIPLAPGAAPLVLDGTIGSSFITGVVYSQLGAPYTAIKIAATCTITETLRLANIAFNSVQAGDRLLEIDPSASIPAPGLLSIIGCQIDGPGQLFAGTVGASDVRVFSATNVNGPTSQWIGDASFNGGGTPIQVTHDVTPSTFIVMPSSNVGPTATLTLSSLAERFVLDIVALQDWSVDGTGRTDDVTGVLEWSAVVSKVGGATRQFLGLIQYDDGVSGWQNIPETLGTGISDATARTVSGSSVFRWNRSWHFRLAIASDTSLAVDSISTYRIAIVGRP